MDLQADSTLIVSVHRCKSKTPQHTLAILHEVVVPGGFL